VRDRPAGVAERDLRHALAQGWGIHAAAMRYVPEGGGSYHWAVRDREGERRFVTVDDLDDKAWLGDTRAAVLDGLRAAMDTALALRRRAGLRFVAAPIPALGTAGSAGSAGTAGTAGGATVWPLGSRYAVTVFPFLDGSSGSFADGFSAHEHAEVVDLLAALHRSTPTVTGAPVRPIELPLRRALDAALHDLYQPWTGGPFAEPARALLTRTAGHIRHLLATFDRLADHAEADTRAPVITHGEPHPANFVRVGAERMLIDWDTVGLAPPERDLLWTAGEELRRYTAMTGRPVDPAVLRLYRLRWALDDISSFVTMLRAPHRHTADAEHAWQALKDTIELYEDRDPIK
jgi:spectinomycin phosphotransferase